jgi:hypothetical protein
MIRGGFLAPSIREDLIALVRDGKAETRLTRRANALLLLVSRRFSIWTMTRSAIGTNCSASKA